MYNIYVESLPGTFDAAMQSKLKAVIRSDAAPRFSTRDFVRRVSDFNVCFADLLPGDELKYDVTVRVRLPENLELLARVYSDQNAMADRIANCLAETRVRSDSTVGVDIVYAKSCMGVAVVPRTKSRYSADR